MRSPDPAIGRIYWVTTWPFYASKDYRAVVVTRRISGSEFRVTTITTDRHGSHDQGGSIPITPEEHISVFRVRDPQTGRINGSGCLTVPCFISLEEHGTGKTAFKNASMSSIGLNLVWVSQLSEGGEKLVEHDVYLVPDVTHGRFSRDHWEKVVTQVPLKYSSEFGNYDS